MRTRARRSARPGPSWWRAAIHVALALIVLAAAVLAVAQPLSYRQFQARVVASEGAHWTAIAAIILVVSIGWSAAGRAAAVAGIVAAALASVPVARAVPVAARVPAALAEVFRPPALDVRDTWLGRPAPLVAADLFRGLGLPSLAPATRAYATRDGVKLEMDVLTAGERRGAAPGLLVIHGGGWSGGTRREFDGLSRYLAARGYVVASVDYRLAPRWPFPAASQDVADALTFLKTHGAELGMDPGRIVVLGRSAGGHLALLLAYTAHDPAIRGVVSFYGPTDLPYGYEHPADPRVFDSSAALTRVMGGRLSARRGAYEAASPIRFVTGASPPTLLIHGTPDELVDIEQARRLDRRLRDAGVRHLLIELPWASHGCDYFLRGPCGQISTWAVERFLMSVTTEQTGQRSTANDERR